MTSSSTPSAGLRVAIVGGGLGGLCTAAFLHRAGVRVTVYEQAPELSQVGAGIAVGPNASSVLRHLGLTAALNKAAEIVETGWEFRRWQDSSVLFSQELGERCLQRYGAHEYVIHRKDLLDILLGVVPDEIISLGRRCVQVRQDDDAAYLTFADGSTVAADVVIGADGIHSVVRTAVVGTTPATYSGLCAWRCLIPADKAPAFARRPVQTIWIGHGRHVVHYPIRNREWVNAVVVTPTETWVEESWTATGAVEDLVAEFEGWDEKLVDLLAASPAVGRWALLEREPLPRWSLGRIVLMGDSAHPMLPFLGQGAAQALEDAGSLATCLTGVDTADVAHVLERYQRLRIGRATETQRRSREARSQNHLPDGPKQQVRDREFANRDPLAHNSWLYDHDAVTHAADKSNV
jgi:salicylate hydroxylase